LGFLKDVNPGVRAGFIAGVIYALSLVLYTAYAMIVAFQSFPEILALLGQISRIIPTWLVLLIAVVVGSAVVFIVVLIGSIIMGAVYHWLCDRTGEEWSPLMAVFSGILLAIVLGIVLNIPPSKAAGFMILLFTSPAYMVPLYILYRRAIYEEAASIKLTSSEEELLLALRKKKMKLLEIRGKFGEQALDLLKKLEEGDLVKLTYYNAYTLTHKGKLLAKRLKPS